MTETTTAIVDTEAAAPIVAEPQPTDANGDLIPVPADDTSVADTAPMADPIVETPVVEPVAPVIEIAKVTDAGIGTEVIAYGIEPQRNNGATEAPGVVVRDWANGLVNVKVFTDQHADLWLTSVALYGTVEDAQADTSRLDSRFAVLSTTG